MARFDANDPALQRAEQKISSMPQSSRAIINHALAHSGWANDAMLKKLKLMTIGQNIKQQKGRLNIESKRLSMQDKASKRQYRMGKRQLSLDTKSFKDAKKQDRYANLLSGATFLGNRYLDWKKYKVDEGVANKMVESSNKSNTGGGILNYKSWRNP